MICDDLALNIGAEPEIYMGCLYPVHWEARSGYLNVVQSCVHIRLNPHDLTYIFRFESRLFAWGFVLCCIDNNLFWILNWIDVAQISSKERKGWPLLTSNFSRLECKKSRTSFNTTMTTYPHVMTQTDYPFDQWCRKRSHGISSGW